MERLTGPTERFTFSPSMGNEVHTLPDEVPLFGREKLETTAITNWTRKGEKRQSGQEPEIKGMLLNRGGKTSR